MATQQERAELHKTIWLPTLFCHLIQIDADLHVIFQTLVTVAALQNYLIISGMLVTT